MKFSWKMILLTTILLALSLSIGGYGVVSLTFREQLSVQMDAAQEDMRLFSAMLKAITLAQQQNDAQTTLQSLVRDSETLEGYEFSVWDEDGELIFSTRKMKTQKLYPSEELYISESRITDQEYIVTTVKLMLCGQSCYLQREQDVSQFYEQAMSNITRYQWIMMVILAIGVAMTMLFTLVLTRPLNRISRTAKQLSSGHYEKRVNVHTKDELGQVAKDFNDMADALEQKIAELADALQRQKDFTSGFAHELKTPLTSVIGYADTLRSRELPPQKRFEAADYIVSEGKRLEAMSFALLDLFALEKQEPEFKLCSMTKLVQNVAKSCEYVLAQKKIRLQTQVQEASEFAVPELLHTLLYNLIDNARKASEENSVICLSGQKSENGYLLRVRDEGRGMPKEALSRLTEPFYMVDKSRARAEGGAGLGLALCERIAALHQSQLTFASEIGKGTEVTLCLGGAVQ